MRADGFRLHRTDPMYTVASYVMNKRTDSMNMITIDIPLEPVRTYLNEKRQQGRPTSHLAVLIAAYLRTVAEFPQLNRFVVNCKPYARSEFAVAMVVLKAGTADNGTMSKMKFELDDTLFDVDRKINAFVAANKTAPEQNSTEKMIRALLSIPGLCRVGVGFFKLLEKHGLCPKAVVDLSPFHNSVVVSDLASIRTNHIYHHIYEFGTTSVFFAMGNLRDVPVRHGGEVQFERCIPLGVVMDERICAGSYFAMAFRRLRKYMSNPALLEQPPAAVQYDPGLSPRQLEKLQKTIAARKAAENAKKS